VKHAARRSGFQVETDLFVSKHRPRSRVAPDRIPREVSMFFPYPAPTPIRPTASGSTATTSTASPSTPPSSAVAPRRTLPLRGPAPSIAVEGIDGPVELHRAAGGYLQVWPRPTPESQRALYAEKFYEEDKSTYLDDVSRDRDYWDALWSIRRGLMERALAPGRRRLLDVGASGGFLLDHFRQHGWSGLGLEPSRRAVAHARERFGLEVYCGELLDPISEPGYPDLLAFDAVHCAQVLEHVLDPEACVARMASLLAHGGVAFVEVPNDFNVLQETARAKLGKPAWWVAPDHHLNYFDAETLSSLLARHGLVEVDRLASFPLEMFLLMGDDYVGHPEVGSRCHGRRMAFERALIEADRIDELAGLYRALARAGLGRTCGILARKDG
jgi:SAM-dependent methyltransferase